MTKNDALFFVCVCVLHGKEWCDNDDLFPLGLFYMRGVCGTNFVCLENIKCVVLY